MEEESIRKNLNNKYNVKNKIIDYMFEIGKDNGFSIDEVEELIKKFLKVDNL